MDIRAMNGINLCSIYAYNSFTKTGLSVAKGHIYCKHKN